MATLQELQRRLADIEAELRTVGNQLNALASDVNNPEFDRLLEERTRLRNQRSEIQRQIDRILLSEARSFYAEIDPGTGLVQIRTSDGLFAGRGNTLEDARRAATANGARPEFLNNLIDPLAKAAADQGPGTVSAGTTVSQEQQANAQGAGTQNPAAESQSVTDQGTTQTSSANTLPSNAVGSDTGLGIGPAPPVLPGPDPDPAANVVSGSGTTQTVPLNNTGSATAEPTENPNLVSYVYKAHTVVSNFRQGKFTQDIEGAQIFFTAPAAGAATVTNLSRDTTVSGPATSLRANTANVVPQNNAAGAIPQDTVAAVVATPGSAAAGGVSYAGQVGAEFAAFEGTGEIPANPNRAVISARSLPGSSFAAEGFIDPTIGVQDDPAGNQPVTVSPLTTKPPTTDAVRTASPQTGAGTGAGTVTSPGATAVRPDVATIRPSQTNTGITDRTELTNQLTQARRELAENQRLLAGVQQRIDRKEGDPALNRDLQALYTANIQREQRLIDRLETQLANPVGTGSATTNVAPQLGAKEY
jgi:hypothetical protein